MYYITVCIGKEEEVYNDIQSVEFEDKQLDFWYLGKLGSLHQITYNLKDETEYTLKITYKK